MSDLDLAEQDVMETVILDEKEFEFDREQSGTILEQLDPEEAPAPSEPTEDQPPAEDAPPEEVVDGVEGDGVEGEATEEGIIEEIPAEPEEEVEPEVVYGGIEGPNSMYITLISSDHHRFIIKRRQAIESGTLRQMLITPGPGKSEEEKNIIRLTIPSHLVERICSFLIYRDVFSKSEASVEDFDFVVEPYLAFPLLMAANFLTC